MQKFKKIISIVILLVLIPILFMSMVILINSYTHPNKIPSFFGWKPFIVLSGSMETQISVGDVVVVKEGYQISNLEISRTLPDGEVEKLASLWLDI